MKRWSPIAYPGPGDSHRNFNQGTGERGSWIDGRGYQQMMDELSSATLGTGHAASESDSKQLLASISSGIYLGAAGGSANGLTATIPGGVMLPELIAGMRFSILVSASNTGAATLDLTGFTIDPAAKPVVRQDGAALNRGDLNPGVRNLVFDGTSFRLFSLIPQSERTLTLFASAQSLPNNVETSIVFATPAGGTDPLGFFSAGSPGIITIPAGLKRVKITGVLATATNNVGYRQSRILHNGGAIPASGRIAVQLPTAGNICPLSTSPSVANVSPGDTFSMLGFQNSGGSLAIDAASTFLLIEY